MNNGLNYPTLPQKHISILRWLDAHQERQIVVLAASLLIVLWIGLTYWVVGAREQILQSRRETLVQTAEVAAGQTRQLLGQIRASLHATNHWLALHPNVDPGNSREFISLVNGLREASGNRIDVRMVTRDAKLAYVPNRITASETDVSDREYYSAQQSPNTRGFYIASTVFSRVTKKWGIPISAPVDPLNRYVSIVFGAIELETLHEMQKPLLRDAGASVTLLRNDSNILSRLPLVPELIGKKLELSTDWIEHISKGGQGSFVSDRAPTDGRRRLVRCSP